jgi:hypothetical protein
MFTTLQSVKQRLCLLQDYTERDAFLNELIAAASALIESKIDRHIALAEYEEWHAGGASAELVLREWPVARVHSVCDAVSGEEISPETYTVHKNGVLVRPLGWSGTLRYPAGLRVFYLAGYAMPGQAQEGAPPLPEDIVLACAEFVCERFRALTSGFEGLSAFSVGDVSWTFSLAWPKVFEEVCQAYKRRM